MIEFTPYTIESIKKTLTVSDCLDKIQEISEWMIDPLLSDITKKDHSESIQHYLKCIKILDMK